jgi:hypothetical protein
MRFHGALLVVVIVLAGGCSSTTPTKEAGFREQHEPRILAIRNNSGRQAQSIVIQDAEASDTEPRRMGSISPVAQNLTYTFIRAKNAAPLPATVRVRFNYPREPEHSQTIDLRQVAQKATGGANEALVFEIRSDDSVTAYLDQVQP